MPAMNRRVILIILACVTLLLAACGSDSSSGSAGSVPKANGSGASRHQPKVEDPKGPPPKKLVKKELIEGSGRKAKAGDEVTLHYVGVNYKTGKQFSVSWGKGPPFVFKLGSGIVIPGLEEGVTGMKLGGRRELIIPPKLGYGSSGLPPAIPGNETIVFVVDLISLKS